MLLACYAMILRHSAIIAKSDENISRFLYLPPNLDIVYFSNRSFICFCQFLFYVFEGDSIF
jgi:hypothetical protein